MTRTSVVAAATLAAMWGVQAAPERFEVPRAVFAPIVDGQIDAGEWAGALRLVGAGEPVDARRTELLAKWADGHLYLAVKSQTAPRGKLTLATGSNPVLSDSVEFWFDPPRARRTVEQKKFGSFQIILPWKGEPFLCHHDPGYGLPSAKWGAGGLSCASAIHGDEWHVELVLATADLGLASFAGIDLPILAVRNFRIGGDGQKAFGRTPTSFTDSSSYPSYRLVDATEGLTHDWYGAAKPTAFDWKTPEAALVADGKGLAFCDGESVEAAAQIPVPGAVLLRTRTDAALTKGWRRYFASAYRPHGYFGFQEDADNGRAMLLFAHGFKGASAVNRRLKCPAAGRESVIVVNIEPRKLTYYLNGVKQGETDLVSELKTAELGPLTLGGGASGLQIPEWGLYSRTLDAAEVKALSMGETPLSGTVGWYQECESLALALMCDPVRVPGGCLSVAVRGAETAEPLFQAVVPLSAGVRTGDAKSLVVLHEKVATGRLPEGDYVASVSVAGAEDDVLIEKPFRVKRYEWLGNSVGKSDCVLMGFTPVAVKGRTLSCVLRDYELGTDGLPMQIVADGEAILARPVALMAERNGVTHRLSGGERAFSPRRLSDTTVEYVAEGKYKTVRARFEQDGLLTLDLELPRVPNVARLWLEIPVKAKYAPLFHACGEGVRANPAGRIPEGTGVVFKSRDIPQTHLSNFIPYCWVGTDTRGICYAADTDRDWAHGVTRDAVEIVRETDGTVAIVLNLLNAPYDMKRPRTFTLGLMASPVKRQPQGWRGWSDGFAYVGTRNARCLYAPPYWGGFCAWAQRYPVWGEMECVRKLRTAMDTGAADTDYFGAFIERVAASFDKRDDETNWLWGKTPETALAYVRAHVSCGYRIAKELHGKPNPILYPYTCDADHSFRLAEHATFGDSWGANCSVAVASYADYALWYLDRMLEAGFQGVYNDNTFVNLDYNWATGAAWVDEKGEVHPSCGIWAGREYHRRQAVAMTERGLFPWITMHHTNGNILPKLSYGMNTMGMEWKYGKSDFQTRYAPEYIRAVCQGKQLGVYPTVIDGVTDVGDDSKPEQIRVTRTLLATTLVHDLRPTCPHGSDMALVAQTCQRLVDWGVGEDDCDAFLYWDGTNPVICSDKDVFVTTYRRGGRLLCIVASWSNEDRTAILSAQGVKTAHNLETGMPLGRGDEGFRLPLPRHDFALVEMK